MNFRKPAFISRPTTRPVEPTRLLGEGLRVRSRSDTADLESNTTFTHTDQLEHTVGIRRHGGALYM